MRVMARAMVHKARTPNIDSKHGLSVFNSVSIALWSAPDF